MPAGAERSKDPPDPPILLPLLRGFSGAVRFPLVALASLALFRRGGSEEDRGGSSSWAKAGKGPREPKGKAIHFLVLSGLGVSCDNRDARSLC